MRLFDKYDAYTIVGPPHPTCMSTASTKHPLVFIEAQTSGWTRWAPPERPDKEYIRAAAPGSHVVFDFHSGAEGIANLKVTYLKSKTFGMGSVLCWVDDLKDKGRRLDGWWNVDVVCAKLIFLVLG